MGELKNIKIADTKLARYWASLSARACPHLKIQKEVL